MNPPIPPPPEIRRRGIDRVTTNRTDEHSIVLDPTKVLLLLGDELLAAIRQSTTGKSS